MPVLKREVLYPLFLKCLKYADDTFWANIFEELSYNNCPVGSYISKGFFCSNVKGKEFIYKFVDKHELKIYNDIVKLLRDKLNIMSKNDKKSILTEIEIIEKELKAYKTIEWSSIKKKSIKDIIIQNYLIDSKKKYELSDIQIKKVYNLINLGLMLKSIKNSDISYSNGEITHIKGINFYKGKYSFNIDVYLNFDESEFVTNSLDFNKEKKLLKNL
jgi:hypothetical protein